MAKNYEQEIKGLKEQYNNGVIEKAKSEERLKGLMEKKDEILKRCSDKGITPEELPAKIEESSAKLDALILKANNLFGGEQSSQDESPF